MEHYTSAIVLSRRDVREHDRLISLYTEHLGKITAMARGVRRPTSKMVGHLEPFALITVKMVNSKDSYTISNVETVQRYPELLKDLSLLRLAQSCLILADDLIREGSCDIGVLSLLNQTLAKLADLAISRDEKKYWTTRFGWQLVAHLGYHPVLDRCVQCDMIKLEQGSFGFVRGGMLCSACRTPYDLAVDCAEPVRVLLVSTLQSNGINTWQTALASIQEQALKIMSQFVKAIRGWRIVISMLYYQYYELFN